jgi:hypothetical protein
MRAARRRGATLVLALLALTAAGMAVALLSRAGVSILYETQRARHRADRRNIEASVLAWARRRAAVGDLPAGETDLDVAALGLRSAAAKVVVTPRDDGALDVRVTAACPFGGKTFTRRATYRLPPSP